MSTSDPRSKAATLCVCELRIKRQFGDNPHSVSIVKTHVIFVTIPLQAQVFRRNHRRLLGQDKRGSTPYSPARRDESSRGLQPGASSSSS
jgi:hypothetical protein